MLERLTLKDFRSYEKREVLFTPATVITGKNGSGKSTAIEAVRLLSVGKSFRTSRLDESIRFSAPFFQLFSTWDDAQIEMFYGVQFHDNPIKERRLQVKNTTVEYLDYIGRFPTVVFIPEHLEIILGSPSIRRAYFDGVLWQIDGEFRRAHLELNRVLRERSALLFLIKKNRAKVDELEPWTALLKEKTAVVRSGRERFAAFINERSNAAELKNGELPFEISVHRAYQETDDLIFQEIEVSQNLLGAHRDEISISFRDRQARKYASRGQARTIIATIKVIEAAFLSENGRSPVVLLDDIFSELDATNREFVLRVFRQQFQVIATSLEITPELNNWQVIELDNAD